LGKTTSSEQSTVAHAGLPVAEHPHLELPSTPHESPSVMTIPLLLLAVFSMLLGFMGTPAWPWVQGFLEGESTAFNPGRLFQSDIASLMFISTVVVLLGITLGYWLYGRRPVAPSEEPDVLERLWPNLYYLLRRKYFVDEVYEASVVSLNRWWALVCDWLDRTVWNGVVLLVSYVVVGLSRVNRACDEYVINLGFDGSCRGLTKGGGLFARFQDGRIQRYLRVIGLGLVVLVVLFIWGCGAKRTKPSNEAQITGAAAVVPIMRPLSPEP